MYFEKTALYRAVEKGNIDMVKYLLTNANLDINLYSIQKHNFSYNFIIK